MPEQTLFALADHGESDTLMLQDGGDAEAALDGFTKAGVDLDALAARLQQEGAAAFVKSLNGLLACIAERSAQFKKAG